MPRTKAPPRVKDPYSERGGSRFRIRVCDPTRHRDLYFATLHEAQAGVKQAARALAPSSPSRQLGNILDAYTNDRVHRGLCGAQSDHDERLRLRRWLAGSLQEDIGKLTAKRAAGYYEQLEACIRHDSGKSPRRYRRPTAVPLDEAWANYGRRADNARVRLRSLTISSSLIEKVADGWGQLRTVRWVVRLRG